jgi:hypothetical protein
MNNACDSEERERRGIWVLPFAREQVSLHLHKALLRSKVTRISALRSSGSVPMQTAPAQLLKYQMTRLLNY